MKNNILKYFILLLSVLVILTVYLSTVGIETDKFNSQIKKRISTINTNKTREINKMVNTWLRNLFVFALASIMLGVSDWERAPSPKKLRKTFGILKITTKISWILPAPK